MNSIHLEISESNGASRAVHVPIAADDTLEVFAGRITEHAGVDGHAVLEIALEARLDDMSKELHEMPLKHRELKLHRVCVEVHFETFSERHWFPAQAKWARVHRWACRKFEVAHDACANLELREGSPSGARLNERDHIGASDECKIVWLVKPGPESNG